MEIKEFLAYLHDLHLSGRVCVFFDYAGHVDWIDVRIKDGKENYEDEVWTKTSIHLNADFSECVAEIEEAIKKHDEEKAEKNLYLKLKEKYEKKPEIEKEENDN